MLTKEDYAVIKTLTQRGVYQKDIAAELGVHPKTVSRALKRGQAPTPVRMSRLAKLAPFIPLVDHLLATSVWNAVVIFRELQAAGYTGQLTMLRAYIAPKRALRPSRVTVRFETAPGVQLQSDWGTITTVISDQPTVVHFIVNQLAFSRRFHFWCTTAYDTEHTAEGLIQSLEYFGGVPQEVLVDNQKVAVLAHPPHQPAHFTPRFLDLAHHYGFAPRACRPYRARTKGKDERMVGYIKHHFFAQRAPATVRSRAGRTSTSAPSSGCVMKPTNGCMGPCTRSLPTALHASSPICGRSHPSALTRRITRHAGLAGMGISMCRAIATAFRAAWQARP